jgi:aspartate aminotransferase
MSIKINARVSRVEPSMTLALTARAKSMTAEGIDVVGFAAGEPDFDTPEVIRERAKDAIDEGATRYTPSSGTPELRKAICAKLKRENKLEYSPDQVIVSCGAKHTLYNIFMTMLEEGDEVLLPAPYWLSYPEQIALAGGKTVVIPATSESEYKITPEQLEQAITPKTVAFLINSPGNPTGALYTPEEIVALAKVLEQHPGITIISDEIYERLIYGGGRHLSFAAATPAMYERTLTVNGMSKTYAMTGWRIGYCAGPKDFIGAMGKMQSHSTSNATSFCQAASVTALEKGESDILRMRAAFDERRRDMVAKLNAIPGVVCPEPLGAFYTFPDVSALYAKAGVEGVDRFLREAAGRSPGRLRARQALRRRRAIRLSYATSPERIGEGLRRIEDFVKNLG